MPSKTVYANEIKATDTIELGGMELIITDVNIDDTADGQVYLTMLPIGHDAPKFYAYMPKYWPTTIRSK